MLFIWAFTAISNAGLCLILLLRGFYVRRSWLFASTALSVIADMIGLHAWMYNSSIYPMIWRIVYFLFLGVNGMIIWEAFCLRDRRVQVPMEAYLSIELLAFLAEKTGFGAVSYNLMCGLRVLNLLMILYFVVVFLQEPIDYD